MTSVTSMTLVPSMAVAAIVFEEQPPVVASAPNRADIACFVGFIGRRRTPVPDSLRRWLFEQGWGPLPDSSPSYDPLLDVPVPIESWELFDRLFAWDQRPVDSAGSRLVSTYLGAAVRSFFFQGGRKCYVVRAGDPRPLTAARATRIAALTKLLPGYPQVFDASPVDRTTWHGAGHLFGLPDVSFLCLPDLADAVAVDSQPVVPLPAPPPGPEQWVECSPAEPPAPADRAVRGLRAPRCDEQGYDDWASAVRLMTDLLARSLREVQLVAAVPLPVAGGAAERDLLAFLGRRDGGPLTARPSTQLTGVASAFVQLVYPWARTLGSGGLPEQLESPEGVLTGVLARTVLAQGTFRSAAGAQLGDVYDLFPLLRRDQVYTAHPDTRDERASSHRLVERVSLFGRTPAGFVLLSDVTASLDESYRPAGVNRLVSAIVRAARRLGEAAVFEASSERLWMRLRDSLSGLLGALLRTGALQGATPAEAFDVACDRSTMSQSDLDNGRVVARVRFRAALPIEQITVALALEQGGQVSLLAPAA